MPSLNRSIAMPQTEIGVYHLHNRCVQQAFLCGYDAVNNIDYSHRKIWIWQKLKLLMRAFAIDLFKCSLMDNHLHLLLRNRPDLVEQWSDEEVARRWWVVCPERVEPDGSASEPEPKELEQWLNDPERMLELRHRLSNPSWLMQIWCSYIGRRANRETEKTGRFFEERFKSVRLLDEAAVLACALYIDLNPIRAGMADTPETSDYTSAQARIVGRKQRLARALAMGLDASALTQDGGLPVDVLCEDPADADSWLGRLTLDAEERLTQHLAQWFEGADSIEWEHLPPADPTEATTTNAAEAHVESQAPQTSLNSPQNSAEQAHSAAAELSAASTLPSDIGLPAQFSPLQQRSTSDQSPVAKRPPHSLAQKVRQSLTGLLPFPAPRASNKGLLSLTLDAYLELLDWTGRQLHPDKKGTIPANTPPILERLGLKIPGWLDLVDNISRWFGVAVGRIELLEQEASRVGRNWLWRRRELAAVYASESQS
jgi:REP element-mobilizing transposase RayT